MALSFEEVINAKNSINIKNQAFINGKYVNSVSGKVFEDFSPVDGKLVTSVAECDIEDINNAVKAARAVFEKGSWSRMAPNKRKKILFKLADLMKKNILELGILETLDMGKPISAATGDIAACINCLNWYAEAIDKIYDDVAPTRDNIIAMITKEPLGVVGAVDADAERSLMLGAFSGAGSLSSSTVYPMPLSHWMSSVTSTMQTTSL